MAEETLADRLRLVRGWSGLSGEKLGRLAGRSRSYVSLVENERNRLGGDALLDIAAVLGVEPQWLLRGEGKIPTERSVQLAVKRARGSEERRAC